MIYLKVIRDTELHKHALEQKYFDKFLKLIAEYDYERRSQAIKRGIKAKKHKNIKESGNEHAK